MTQSKIDLTSLSSTQKLELLKELELEQENSKKKRDQNIDTLKQLVDQLVLDLAPELADFQTTQNLKIEKVFNSFADALALKKEIYNYKDDQASHTFSARNGMASITLGHNEIIGFDGTEGAGVIKIREYLASLSEGDEKRRIMTKMLNTFMKPDKKGNLNPAKVAELVSHKADAQSDLFSDGVDIIINAQFKTRSSQYVRGWYKIQEKNGKELKLSFSITASS